MTTADIEAMAIAKADAESDGTLDGMRRAWMAHMAGLKATYHRFVKPGLNDDPRIAELLDPGKVDPARHANNWAIPNEIEILLVDLTPNTELDGALASAFATAERINVPSSAALKARVEATKDPMEKRGILATLLRDTQNRYASRRSERVARRGAAWRMARLGFGLVAAIVLVMLWLGKFGDFGTIVKMNLLVSTYFGFLGAYLSRLIAFQNSVTTLSFDDIEYSYSWHFLFVRLLVGGLSSVIVYMLISANLLGDDLFPSGSNSDSSGFGVLWGTYKGSDNATYQGPTTNFAKLIIWCFIAGFFERFLPDRIGAVVPPTDTEKK